MGRIIDLEKKVVIVTGAGSGIGRETCRVLASEGATVIMMDISVEGLAETARFVGEQCQQLPIDLTDSKAVADVVADIVEKHGKLDGLVHCAGISSRKPLNVLSRDGFTKIMDVNFFSFVELVKQCAKRKHFNQGGSIVVMSSISSIVGYKAKSEYCVSKAAVDAFVRCMAQELAPQGIRVNSIMPVAVDTPMGRRAADISENVGATETKYDAMVQPTEVANTIAFLLSNAAPSISGSAIPMFMPQLIDNQTPTPPPHPTTTRSIVQVTCNSLSCGQEMRLHGKKILYIGGQTGIDVAILQRLTEYGTEIVQYEPSSIDKIEADIKWMVSECGNIDGLVFGIVHSDFRPLQLVKSEVVNQIMSDNYGLFVEVMRCLKKSRGLSDGASIVAMSSISSSRAMKAKMAFCASKAALDAAVRCLAVELADRGIRVNSIQKGAVDVDTEKSHIQDVMAIRSDITTQDNTAPLGIVKADEIAQMVAFLLSDAIRTITGTSIVIDGGYLA